MVQISRYKRFAAKFWYILISECNKSNAPLNSLKRTITFSSSELLGLIFNKRPRDQTKGGGCDDENTCESEN